MALTFNGSTGYLSLTGISPMITAYPFSLLIWIKPTSGGANQETIYHGDSSQTTDTEFYVSSAVGTMRGNARVGSTSYVADGNNAIDTANWRLAIYSATSATARRTYYYSGTPVEDTSGGTPVFANFDRVFIGARPDASLKFNGSLAEAHLYSVALTSTNYSNLADYSVTPESITGWVDGWILDNTDADTQGLVSIGGTRTLTLTGGVTNLGSHPISITGRGASAQSQAPRSMHQFKMQGIS